MEHADAGIAMNIRNARICLAGCRNAGAPTFAGGNRGNWRGGTFKRDILYSRSKTVFCRIMLQPYTAQNAEPG